jgi:hypothetical protein
MSWSRRLQQMIMAGGVFSFSACGSSHGANPPSFPCGNANADPCICGRAGNSPDAAQLCDACLTNGGQWLPATSTTQPGLCAGGADAGGGADADAAGGGGADAAGGGGADAAGGTDGAAAAEAGDTGGVIVPPFPFVCGNANPDPCICGRAGNSPDAAEICEACGAGGGQWQPATSTQPERCIGGHDASATDASDASG